MKTNITRIMVDEHQLILRVITLVERNTALMEQGRFRDWQFFLDAVDFIRNYADRFHHAKEEDALFPALSLTEPSRVWRPGASPEASNLRTIPSESQSG